MPRAPLIKKSWGDRVNDYAVEVINDVSRRRSRLVRLYGDKIFFYYYDGTYRPLFSPWTSWLRYPDKAPLRMKKAVFDVVKCMTEPCPQLEPFWFRNNNKVLWRKGKAYDVSTGEVSYACPDDYFASCLGHEFPTEVNDLERVDEDVKFLVDKLALTFGADMTSGSDKGGDHWRFFRCIGEIVIGKFTKRAIVVHGGPYSGKTVLSSFLSDAFGSVIQPYFASHLNKVLSNPSKHMAELMGTRFLKYGPCSHPKVIKEVNEVLVLKNIRIPTILFCESKDVAEWEQDGECEMFHLPNSFKTTVWEYSGYGRAFAYLCIVKAMRDE